MTSDEIVPATPEEYRKMLDEIGLYTREVEEGIDAVWWRGRRSIRLRIIRERLGWWDVCTVDPWHKPKDRLWSSLHATTGTREFIENWLKSQR